LRGSWMWSGPVRTAQCLHTRPQPVHAGRGQGLAMFYTIAAFVMLLVYGWFMMRAEGKEERVD
jgi:hypothetical protein